MTSQLIIKKIAVNIFAFATDLLFRDKEKNHARAKYLK